MSSPLELATKLASMQTGEVFYLPNGDMRVTRIPGGHLWCSVSERTHTIQEGYTRTDYIYSAPTFIPLEDNNEKIRVLVLWI